MQERTRQRILLFSGILLLLLLGLWWYSGFSLDFMRFFAAQPPPSPGPTIAPPPGCYYQEVQCIQAPCPPQLVCPSCLPRPACLDTAPPTCDVPEPAGGFCPGPPRGIVFCFPETQTVRVGALASVTGSGGDGNYNWFSPDGNPSGSAAQDFIGPAYQTTYSTPGTKKVTVTAGRTGTPGFEDSVACTVIVTP